MNGLPGFGFSDRPDKPWLGVDYFDARNSDYNLDLAEAMGQYRDRPSLHQAATLSGIPGKIDERKFGCGNVAPGQAFGDRGLQ